MGSPLFRWISGFARCGPEGRFSFPLPNGREVPRMIFEGIFLGVKCADYPGLARFVSPEAWVTKDLPPVLLQHGAAVHKNNIEGMFLGGEMKDSDPSWIKKIYGMLSEVNYTKEELEMIRETRYLNDIWEEIIEEEKQKALEEKQRASAAEEKALETEKQLAKEREERLRLEEQIKELMKEAR